jgi:hypothetical protein
MKHILTTMIISALVMSSGAYASTISYSGSFSGLTDVTNQSIQVHQFDTNLGTLTGVSFSLDATMKTQLQVNNDGNFFAGWDLDTYKFSLIGDSSYNNIAIAQDGSGQRVVGTGAYGSLADSVNGVLFKALGTGHNMQNITSADANNVGSALSYVWTQKGPTLTASNTFNLAASSAFQGVGFLSFFLTTNNNDSFSVGGTQTGGQPANLQSLSTNVLAHVNVDYTYISAVPVPPAFALFASGLLGLGVLRKKVQA